MISFDTHSAAKSTFNDFDKNHVFFRRKNHLVFQRKQSFIHFQESDYFITLL